MLVTLNDILPRAKKEKFAIGLFNTINLEMAKGVIAAAEELHAPAIIGTAEVLLPYAELEELTYFLKPMAEKAKVPIVLHFDHGLSEARIKQAIELGFSSIMYDCSTYSFDENIEKVAEMVKFCHSREVSVEAEIGHVGSNEGSTEGVAEAEHNDDSIYTDPIQAKYFAEQTHCDALAIAIGTSHGAYKNTPRLDFERLHEISTMIPTPLVLHGGSGLSNQDFQACISNGISKVNIFTDVNCAALDAAVANYQKGKGLSDVLNDITEAVKQATMVKMRLFSCEGKA